MAKTMPSIDEILAQVRSDAPDVAAARQTETGRRHTLGTIPHISKPDDGEVIPLGKPSYLIEEFAALDDADFLKNAYRVVLGRELDPTGRDYYLPLLKSGHVSVVRVLSALSRSAEGKARGVKIRWLAPAAVLDRLSNLSTVGRFFAPFMGFIVRSTTNQRLALLSDRHRALINDTNSSLMVIRKNQADLDLRANVSRKDIDELTRRMESAVQDAEQSLSEIQASRRELNEQRAALSALISKAATSPEGEDAETAKVLQSSTLDTLYVAFENRFRGSTAEIARRCERYLPIFRTCPPVAEGADVLDIGCGRGEFISLLKRNNISARGADLNKAMVDEARALGHDVHFGDAVAYLHSLPDASLSAITGFHIVEHIAFQDLVQLFDAALRVLKPGGFVLFETPNPENLVVGACTFHYDPTHNKPIPPDYLRFVAEARGFETSRVIRRDEDCDLSRPESGFAPEHVNDWFKQPADYALLAQKSQNSG